MKNKIIRNVIIAVIALLIAATAVFTVTANKISSPVIRTDSSTSISNSESFLKSNSFDADSIKNKENVSVENVTYLSRNENSVYMNYICSESYVYDNDTVILIPPFGYDYSVMLPVAEHFIDKGYNVISFDQRMHGSNDGDSFTFGRLEADDLQTVIDYINMNRSDSSKRIGVYAQGTGAFTAAYYLSSGYNKDISFAIFDDPYLSPVDYIEYSLKNTDSVIPYETLCKMAESTADRKYSIRCSDINMISYAAGITVPSLVLYQKGCDSYNETAGSSFFEGLASEEKYSEVFENTELFEAFFDQNEKYTAAIDSFIEK